MTKRSRRRGPVALLWLGPALLFYGAFVIVPYAQTIWYSFYDWDGIGVGTWTGLGNYAKVFTQPDLLASVKHALGFTVYFSLLPVCIALVLAAFIADTAKSSWTGPRIVLFLPQVVPLVASGVAWTFVYNSDGLLNKVLSGVGLGRLAKPWLGDFTWAYPAVGIVGTWVGVGFCLALFVAGMQKIDYSLYEAVRLDGGGRIREFFTITIRQLRGEITVAATVTVISALASFDLIYVLTNGGGPGTTTTVPGVSIYHLAFGYNQVGLAAALGIVLSLIVYALVLAINIVLRDRDHAT